MSEVKNVGIKAFLAQQYAPKQFEKILPPDTGEKVKSELNKNADDRSVIAKISAASHSMLEKTRALEKRRADKNINNAAIDKRLETVSLESQSITEAQSSKVIQTA